MPNLNPNSTNYTHSYEPNTNDLTMAMDYDKFGRPVVRTRQSDVDSTDSKNRLRVSTYETIFFNTFQYDKEPFTWDEVTYGDADATHSTLISGIVMRVGGTAGDKIIRQMKRVNRYIPGRATTATFSFRLQNPQPGIRRRFGVFDELNGMYFEDDGSGTYYCVIRSNVTGSVVERRVPREEWNGNKLDGTGPSSIEALANAQHLVNFDYEWYGAGQVKIGFSIYGVNHVVHTFNNANVLTNPWCSTPFLPIRLELENVTGETSGNHYFYQGSNSVTQEGQRSDLGTMTNISTPTTGYTLSSANTFYPVVSIRLKPANLQGVIIPLSFQCGTLDNTSVFYKLIYNPTLTGGTWTDHPFADSFSQYNRTATSYTGGVDLISGFLPSTSTSRIELPKEAYLQLGRSNMGTTSDNFTLAIAAVNSNKKAFGSLTWVEQR